MIENKNYISSIIFIDKIFMDAYIGINEGGEGIPPAPKTKERDMTRYFSTEIQSVGSRRAPTETIRAASIASAKRQATQRQMFQNTVLCIGTELDANGHVIPVAYRRDGIWTEVE